MDNTKKVIAKIQDAEYTLIGTVDQSHIDEISQKVDKMISDVKRDNPLANPNMVFILSCLNLASEITKLEKAIDGLNERVKGIEDVNDLKEQLSTYKEYSKQNNERINELKLERDSLKNQVEEYEEAATKNDRKLKQYRNNIEESRKTILELQNQLFESQIELVKTNNKSLES